MRLYIKLFLYTGIPFGVIMGIIVGYSDGLSRGILSGLIQGLIFGFFMSLILGTTHKMTTKNIFSDLKDYIRPHQTLDVSFNESLDSVFEKCLQSLNKIKAKAVVSNKEKCLITAKMPMSWKSFGEEIEIKLSKESETKIRATVTSTPSFKTTLLDYGKGRQNVTLFVKELKS